MPPQSDDRRREFERHVRQAERAEKLRTAAPFVAIGVAVVALIGGMSWYNMSSVPCGTINGAVQAVRTEATLNGQRHFLTVLGDDNNNYYSEDPQDRAAAPGDRVTLTRSCSHAGAPRPMAHFDHWLAGESGSGRG